MAVAERLCGKAVFLDVVHSKVLSIVFIIIAQRYAHFKCFGQKNIFKVKERNFKEIL